MKKKIHRQRPVKGGRKPLPSCVLKSIRARVEQDAWVFGVSRSWVVSCILAAYYGIHVDSFKEAGK